MSDDNGSDDSKKPEGVSPLLASPIDFDSLPKKPGTQDIDYGALTPEQCKALWDAEEGRKARFKKFAQKYPLKVDTTKHHRKAQPDPFPTEGRAEEYAKRSRPSFGKGGERTSAEKRLQEIFREAAVNEGVQNPPRDTEPNEPPLPEHLQDAPDTGDRIVDLQAAPEPAATLAPRTTAPRFATVLAPHQPNNHTLYSLKAEWELLKETADTHFPNELIKGRLTPSQRLVAIAHCLGWTYEEIKKGSGIGRGEIMRWMARPDVKRFVEDFNLHAGKRPVMDRVDQLQFAALTVIERLMMDKLNPPKVRFQAAAWLFERKHGSAVQKIDHRVNDLRALTERLMQADAQGPRPTDFGLDPNDDLDEMN